MSKNGIAVTIGSRRVGRGEPVYVIAEIGINHNGSVSTALELIDIAARFGCDAVKFQKRTPELCVPDDQKDAPRDTPWGVMTYLDYRHRVELSLRDFEQIDAHCRNLGIQWFASCWDEPSVDFIAAFNPPAFKIASASLTDDGLLSATVATGKPLIASTGMSTLEEIDHAVEQLPRDRTIICHSTSAYPCDVSELNLRAIPMLEERYQFPVGYSGHETGLPTTIAAVALGAVLVERHVTLDRSMWGSDQAASLGPGGLERLVRHIRATEAALGDGVKRVYDSEQPSIRKLRRK